MNSAVLAAYALFVAVVSLRPADGASIEPWDKVLHFVTYAIFAVLAYRVLGGDRRYLLACLAIVLYSGLIEVAQSFIPGRVMSGLDLLANVLGVIAGAVIIKRLSRIRTGE